MSFRLLFPLFQQLAGKDDQAAAPAEPGAGKGGEGVSGKHAGGIVIRRSYLHCIGGGTKKTKLLLGPKGVVSGVEIGGSSYETLLSEKQKSPCLHKETKAKTSAVPLFLPENVRPLKLCPVTGAPGGAYLMFSPLLQGDFPGSLPSASHQTAALCACWGQVLVLFCAFCLCAKYLICFFWECQGPRGREMRKY